MANILMCIPTRNRAEMVKEVLEYEIEYYKRCGVELCYYDSSDGEETREIIEEINAKYGVGIQYRKCDVALCLDYKLIEILKDFEKADYEYLWLVNDSISIKEEMIERVCQAAKEGYDLIRLPLAGEGLQEDIITTSPNEWFHNCSQGMAHMASTIMNLSLLKGAEHKWDILREKYVGCNELNDDHGYFFMVAFYLEQILKLERFKGIFIGNQIKWRRDSPLKKEQIYWKDYVFQTWARSYPETILKLPGQYTDKETVIKKSDNISPGRFSKAMLIHYRLCGLYDYSVYKKYKKYFRYITLESMSSCLIAAVLPCFFLRRRYANLLTVEADWQEKLNKLEKQIKGRKILIYGAGLYGEKAIQKLKHDGYGDRLVGVAVTNEDGNVMEIEKVAVHGIDFFVQEREEVFVIVCTLPAAAVEIKRELKSRKFRYINTLFGV